MTENAPVQSEMLQRAFRDTVSDVEFLVHYAVLGLSGGDLADKRVLEIGSGRTNRFGREALKYFEQTDITSINPQLAFSDICEARKIPRELHRGSVAALAQGFLPFKEESFDTVISVMGVPNTLLVSEVPAMFNDVWRVLKADGSARFWPFSHRQDDSLAIRAYDEFMFLETVPQEILDTLPETYKELATRLVIKKPLDTFGIPNEVAFLETT